MEKRNTALLSSDIIAAAEEGDSREQAVEEENVRCQNLLFSVYLLRAYFGVTPECIDVCMSKRILFFFFVECNI